MVILHCHVLALLQGVWFPVIFIVTYTVSVTGGYVTAVFPYVSDTGAWFPGSSIFSIGLGFGSVMMIAIAYTRYREVKYICEGNEFKPNIRFLNRLSYNFNVIAVIGVFILGNIQVVNSLVAHLLATVVAFSNGFLYQVIQTYISFAIYPIAGNKAINVLRAILTIIVAISMGITAYFGVVSYRLFTGDDITKWTKASGGYEFHLISVAAEWVLIHATVFFMASFAEELRFVALFEPPIRVEEDWRSQFRSDLSGF